MTPQEMEARLRQTISDRRLSAGERQALREVLADEPQDDQRAAATRSLAFRIAQEAIDDARPGEVLGWLEDVVKLLHPVRSAVSGAAEALFAPRDNLMGRLCSLFDAARKSADVCVFTITDDRVTRSMLAAHDRGVAVRVITDNDKAHDLGSDIDRLADAGVPVAIDRTEAHMHHKFAVFDGATLATGSYNWTRSASAVNSENLLIMSDAALVTAYRREFERLWRALS